MKYLEIITAILVIIGGLNWGLVGAFDFNLVTFLFSKVGIEKLVYILVGLSAVWQGVGLKDKF